MPKERPAGWVRLKPTVSGPDGPPLRPDKRRRTHRCAPCAARGVKCKGGPTCGQAPLPPSPHDGNQGPVPEIRAQQGDEELPSSAGGLVPARRCLHSTVPQSVPGVYEVRYFENFVKFASDRQMSTKFPCVRVEELVPAALGPNPLYHVGLAIGAIDASRRGTVSTYSGAALAKAFAYTAYRNGVRALRAALAEEDVHQRDDVLVATFLLSLFEVLSEPMGDGWSKHLIHGTCRLVELAGPNLEQPLSFLRRGILAEFRLSEIARAILHGTDTFLAEPVWLEFFRGMGSAKPESWEPQEAMLNLVIMVARFHNRFFNAVEAVPKNERPNLLFLDAFRIKGLELQASIREWYSLASKWQRTANTQSLLWGLGLVYYHALLVHLSDDFVRYFSWSAKPTPSMAEDELREHVDNILSLLIELSSHPYIIGIMLMFPLKLVGSHVTDVETRRKVLGIFDKLYWRGYIASLELKTKMQSSWSNQEEEFEGQLPD